MINFVISFLISFSKPEKFTTKEPKKATKPPTKPYKKVKQLKTTDDGEELPQIEDENLIKCEGNSRNWCSIEYCLLDEVLPKVEINVVTWGAAAKIYTKDDFRCIKTIMMGDVVWVYFLMNHKISDLQNEDVEQLKESQIIFKFSQDQSKMMTRVVNDWPKEFTVNKNKSETNLKSDSWFFELCQSNPLDETYREIMEERLENFQISRPENNSIVSMISLSLYDKTIINKIQEIMPTLSRESIFKNVLSKKKDKKTVKVKKEDLKKEDGGKKFEDRSHLTVRADLLIANKTNIIVEQRDLLPGIKYAAAKLTSSKILKDEQDFIFVPFIVTIENVEDLPLKFLKTLNLKSIFARYELANVLNSIETNKVKLSGTSKDKNVTIDDTRVIFASSVGEALHCQQLMLRPSMLNLAEALLTRSMVVKLYGEVDPPEGGVFIEPCLFGQKVTDSLISTPGDLMFLNYKHPPDFSTEVFLGSATANLIRLVKGFCSIDSSAVMTSAPLSTWDPASDMEDLMDQMENQNEREILLAKFTSPGIIPDTLLFECNTRITITVSVGCQLSCLTEYQMISIPNIYHRVVVLFKDPLYAAKIVERIKQANALFEDPFTKMSLTSFSISHAFKTSSLFDYQNSFHPTSLMSNNRTINQIRDLQRFASSSNRTITGFLIQDPRESILVIEAVPMIIPRLTESLNGLIPLGGRVIHDSSLFFTKRIYGDLSPSYMYSITLSTPLNTLLKNSSNYLKNDPPEPALQALLLLDLLQRSRTLNSICVNQLFPSCEQLISFNNVFGSTYDASESPGFPE